MTHLTMEQLLALREPGTEPGVGALREHLAGCPHCESELERLNQRVARLKALPTLRPARDRFPGIRTRAAQQRWRRRLGRLALAGLALAATLTLAVLLGRVRRPGADPYAAELTEVMTRSRQLEGALASFDPDRGVLDGRTASITATLEDQVASLDRELQAVDLLDSRIRQREALRLWRERVGLLDALVDVHLTRASYVGF